MRKELVDKVNAGELSLGATVLGLYNREGELMARPGGLDVGIDGNLWDILQAAEEQTFVEETIPTGDEIATEKVTGTAEVRLPSIRTVLIRTEVITEDKIVIREPTEVAEEEEEVVEEEEEKSSIWLVLGPAIVAGVLVLVAIFVVVV